MKLILFIVLICIGLNYVSSERHELQERGEQERRWREHIHNLEKQEQERQRRQRQREREERARRERAQQILQSNRPIQG